MSIADTRRRLREWGGWASGGGCAGFPMLSAFMRIHITFSRISEPPLDILRTDHIIARAELPQRKVLIRQYCTRGSIREKAARAGIPKSSYWDLLDEATWFVHTEYDKPDAQPLDFRRTRAYESAQRGLSVHEPRRTPAIIAT